MSDPTPVEATPPTPDPAGTVDAQKADAGGAGVTFTHDGVEFTCPHQLDWDGDALDLLRPVDANQLLTMILGDQFTRWKPGKSVQQRWDLRAAMFAACSGTGPGEASASAAS